MEVSEFIRTFAIAKSRLLHHRTTTSKNERAKNRKTNIGRARYRAWTFLWLV